MSMLSTQTVHLINSFSCGINNSDSQNVMLHAIFTRLIMSDRVTEDSRLFMQTCMTLARLYWDQKWDPASVFLYMLTGLLINDEDPFELNSSAFSQLHEDIKLNSETINGACDLHCDIFNSLWIEQEEESEESEEEEETGESDSSSDK